MNAPHRKPSLRADAGNPATPPGQLRELARRGCAKEVAANPNTPVDLLLKLAPRHFEAFLANPVLPLLLLEDPGFCLKISVTALRRLLRNKQLPATFLQTLARHPDAEVRGAAKLHMAAPVPADKSVELDAALHALPTRCGSLPTLLRLDLLPLWLLEPLGGAANNELRREVLATLQRRRDEPSQVLWRLLERGGLRPPAVDTWTGMAPDLTAEELERLARGGPMARWQAAQHPLTPSVMLQRLAADAFARVALAALGNRSTPETTLWAYAGSSDERCRLQITRNPACLPRLLDQLSHDRSATVRAAVARHRATDDATLSRLAGDPEKSVVLAVLGNRRTGPASLQILGQSPEASIRSAVAAHRCTPLFVAERLVEDADAGVRKALARKGNVTLEIYVRLCCDTNDTVSMSARFFRSSLPDRYKRGLYNLPNSPDELAALLRDWTPRPPGLPAPPPPLSPWKPRRTYWPEHLDREDWERVHRAMKAETPVEELTEFARDPEPKVRENVARNSGAPANLLLQLATDVCEEVRQCVSFNRATPPDALRQLCKDAVPQIRQFAAYHKSCPTDMLEALSADEPKVRGAVAGNPETPVETLRRLASDAACHDALARNPKVPMEVLAELWSSATADSREALAHNPSLPVPLLLEIAALPEDALRAVVAANPSLPTAAAERLADDHAPTVRRAVAARDDLPEDIFRRLAAESTPGMAKILAHNPRTPADILAGYVRHPETDVRHGIISNPATPTATLLDLADDPAMLRHLNHRADKPPELKAKLNARSSPGTNSVNGLLQAKSTPLETFEKIIREGSKEEVQALLYSDQTPEPVLLLLARSSERDHRWALLFRGHMPAAVAAILARDSDDSIRAHLACRHRLPADVLYELLADKSLPDYSQSDLRLSLARRRNTPPDVLIHIAREEVARVKDGQTERSSRFWRRRRRQKVDVLAAVAGRTEVPVALFENALACSYPPLQAALLQRLDLPPEWRTRIEDVTLTAAVQGTARLARLAALTHPRVPRADLLLLADQGNWLERYAVTQNPAAPLETLFALAADANVLVRDAAQTRLAEAQRSKS